MKSTYKSKVSKSKWRLNVLNHKNLQHQQLLMRELVYDQPSENLFENLKRPCQKVSENNKLLWWVWPKNLIQELHLNQVTEGGNDKILRMTKILGCASFWLGLILHRLPWVKMIRFTREKIMVKNSLDKGNICCGH